MGETAARHLPCNLRVDRQQFDGPVCNCVLCVPGGCTAAVSFLGPPAAARQDPTGSCTPAACQVPPASIPFHLLHVEFNP